MLTYTLRRLLAVVPILLGITLLAYGITRSIPGDAVAVMLGVNTTPAVAAELRRQLGLDRPVYEGYVHWLGQVVRGDLGRSIRSGRPIASDLAERFPRTVQLTVAAIFLATLIGIPAGILAATHRNQLADQVVSIVALLGISMPDFWLGFLLILLFSIQLGWLPPAGYISPADNPAMFFQFLLLPALTLGFQSAGIIMRFTHSAFLEILGQDYVRTARSKGLKERVVIYAHTLRNALIPIITIVGLQIGFLLGGAVIIETIFGWPGIGNLAVTAINQRDYPVVQATVVVFAVVFTLVNLIVDLLYGVIDPRVKYS